MYINAHFFLLLNDLAMGMNTKAPDKRIDTISIPSIRGEAVSIKKQSAAHKKMRTTL